MTAGNSFAARLLTVASRLSTAGAVMSGITFALMTFLVLTEVVLRTFFGTSTLVASEYSGYALSAMVYLAMGFSFKEGAHIRISFLRDRIHGLPKFIVEIFCHLFVAILCGLSSLYMWDMFLVSKARNLTAYTVAETPLYVPQFIVFLGLCVLTLQITARLLHLVVAGPKALDEEAGL
jgi:TRAP-type transport system small permease protein